ncbi:MAG: hypothetical protein ACK48M_01775 [Planctomycetia bacterium]|jgi:hypothetical protein
MKLTEYENTNFPTYDIDLEAPPESRWKHLAQKESKNIGRLLDDCVELCVEQADCYPAYIRPLVVAAGKGIAGLGGRLVDMIAASFGEEYVAEIRSVAKHADQPLSHVVLGNLTYDGCQMIGAYGAAGCSSYSCNIQGTPTLVRNMDWVWPRSTGRHSRLIKFHRGKESYTSVSVLGCVGVVSAMCPGKWAVTINQAPTEGTTTSYFQWPVLQRLRNVCDRLGTYRDVVAGLQEYETMTSFFAHVVGTKPTEHTVITGLGDSFRHRGMKGETLLQTNHFIGHRDLEKHNGPERWEDDDGQEWYCDSHYRAKCLTRRLRRPPGTLDDARKKIYTSAVTTEDTMQQMVLQPTSGYSKVWLRG